MSCLFTRGTTKRICFPWLPFKPTSKRAPSLRTMASSVDVLCFFRRPGGRPKAQRVPRSFCCCSFWCLWACCFVCCFVACCLVGFCLRCSSFLLLCLLNYTFVYVALFLSLFLHLLFPFVIPFFIHFFVCCPCYFVVCAFCCIH